MTRRITGQRVAEEVVGHEQEQQLARSAESGMFGAAVAGFALDYAFAEVWTRPGLDRRARRLVTLAVMAALGRPNEFAIHMRGALRDGLTLTEIEEVLVQALPYIGFPAVSTALSAAADVIKQDKLDEQPGPNY